VGVEELKEYKVAGPKCGTHKELSRRIIKIAEIKVQRATNIWHAGVGVDHYDGVRMKKWGANRESRRMESTNALIVCWSPRAAVRRRKPLRDGRKMEQEQS
jgi:hypothetical protein